MELRGYRGQHGPGGVGQGRCRPAGPHAQFGVLIIAAEAALCPGTPRHRGGSLSAPACRSVTLLWRTTSLSSPSLQCMCLTQQAATRSGASARPSAPLWRGGWGLGVHHQPQHTPDLLPGPPRLVPAGTAAAPPLLLLLLLLLRLRRDHPISPMQLPCLDVSASRLITPSLTCCSRPVLTSCVCAG